MTDKWFGGYDGQTAEELLALEHDYRIDSLVLAFEEGIQRKAGELSRGERYVLAVEGLEREVNNGGYSQFFSNSSKEFVDVIEEALLAIGCPKTAALTADAIRALGITGAVTPPAAEDAVRANDEDIEAALNECDARYYDNDEPIADRLFAWIKQNRDQIAIGA